MGFLTAADLEPLRTADLTYLAVRDACTGEVPDGYHRAGRSVVVGSGREAFERAAAAVFDWCAQCGAGLRVRATGPVTEPGTVVVLTAGLPRRGYDIPAAWCGRRPTARNAASPTARCPVIPRAARSAS